MAHSSRTLMGIRITIVGIATALLAAFAASLTPANAKASAAISPSNPQLTHPIGVEKDGKTTSGHSFATTAMVERFSLVSSRSYLRAETASDEVDFVNDSGSFAIEMTVTAPESVEAPSGSPFSVFAKYTLPDKRKVSSYRGWKAPGIVNGRNTGGIVTLNVKPGNTAGAGETFPAGTRVTLLQSLSRIPDAPRGTHWQKAVFEINGKKTSTLTIDRGVLTKVVLTNRAVRDAAPEPTPEPTQPSHTPSNPTPEPTNPTPMPEPSQPSPTRPAPTPAPSTSSAPPATPTRPAPTTAAPEPTTPAPSALAPTTSATSEPTTKPTDTSSPTSNPTVEEPTASPEPTRKDDPNPSPTEDPTPTAEPSAEPSTTLKPSATPTERETSETPEPTPEATPSPSTTSEITIESQLELMAFFGLDTEAEFLKRTDDPKKGGTSTASRSKYATPVARDTPASPLPSVKPRTSGIPILNTGMDMSSGVICAFGMGLVGASLVLRRYFA